MVPAAAVLLDAMGTLVQLERPWPHLVAALGARGVAISEEAARAAMLAEIAYYREHHDEAADAAGVEDLRDRCAGVLLGALGPVDLEFAELRAAMLEALVFRAYPEVPGVLSELRAGGTRLVVVSNWDYSLLEVLARTGLSELVDGVVISALEGVSKPDRRLFERGLEVAGVDAPDAVHVGDGLDADVAGALGAGIRPVYVDRDRAGGAPEGVEAVADLSALLSSRCLALRSCRTAARSGRR